MFKSCQEAITYIEAKRNRRTFIEFQKTIKKYDIPTVLPYTIHIAGTNGKGSTVQYIKEILMSHGYRVGTFTSPYMIVHNDRICINGEPIPDRLLLSYINQLYSIIEEENLSMFEIDVIIMLLYFHQQPLDFCIIETGIGGKEDKTNVITSQISAITNVGFDHQDLLGSTLDKIALHKSGIIKQNQKFFTGETKFELLEIFSQICKQNNTQMYVVEKEQGYQFTYNNITYVLPPVGSYQVYNAKLAVAITSSCITLEKDKTQLAITNFDYPGRFEKIGNVYLDGAHNIEGMEALVDTIQRLSIKDVCIIFSILEGKNREAMLKILSKYPVICASFDDDRQTTSDTNYKEVLHKLEDQYSTIIVTGSLHFVSDVRKYLLRGNDKWKKSIIY